MRTLQNNFARTGNSPKLPLTNQSTPDVRFGVDSKHHAGVAGFGKIPVGLRRRPWRRQKSQAEFRGFIRRLKEDSQFLRTTIQYAFAALCVWIGIEFYFFVEWGLSGGEADYVVRPPGVEGFLPISALISLKYWIQTGILNEIHPSAVVILIAVVLVSVVIKKSFCSWLCPVGTLSEALWSFGRKIFGRTIIVPRVLDYPLRSLKYLLMFFFVWSVAQMDVSALKTFIYSPYNKVADVKMYLFFAGMTEFAFWTLVILVVLSIPIKNFWCRYLCPYGALLGITSWLSPLKIVRDKARCVDCELCTKACPADIKVHLTGNRLKNRPVGRIWSDECTGCLSCVEVCPVKDTLVVRASDRSAVVPPWAIGTLVVGLFVAVTGAAMLADRWQNEITQDEYLMRFQRLDSYQHFQGDVPEYSPND